jgi:hypothetical protein
MLTRHTPDQPELLDRLAEIEERQRVILTDLDHLEGTVGDPEVAVERERLVARVEEAEVRLDRMEKAIRTLSSRQRQHDAAMTSMAQLLAAEPWRR